MWNIFGTILLWIFALIGLLFTLFWIYAWFITPVKKIEQEKNKRKKKTKKVKNK